MKLSDTRNIVIAQALEESDTDERLLSEEEKRLADAAAGAPLPQDASRSRQDTFLAKRAESIIGTVEPRIEGEQAWLRSSPFRSRFSLFALIMIAAAVVIGYLTNELGLDGKINLLSFPLIGIIAWNIIVYLSELLIVFRKNGAVTGIAGMVTKALFPPPINLKKGETEPSLEFRARSLFQSRWRHLNLSPLAARVKSTLHFTALLLAIAAITGMYVRGLAKEYNVVWQSTFFENAEQLRPFLNAILGPAAKIQGGEIPSVEELGTLHQTAAKGEVPGENAAKWIHWYAITIGMYVLIPRLFLGILWLLRAKAADNRLPYRDISPAYFERVLAVSTGDSLGIAIVPYAHKAEEKIRQGMRKYLELEFQRPVSVQWLDPIPFGEEDEAEVEIAKNFQPMLLFNFASTPEKETHLALYRQLSGNQATGGKPIHILLDCEAFDRKSESFNDADERRTARLRAWQNLFASENCEIHVISDHHIAVTEDRGSSHG